MNRNNCGCVPYNPNTNRSDYIKELNDTCDCVLPCRSCECVEQTGSCPPPPPCKPVKRVKCCVDKPKKGFWHFFFSGKKCSPCFKKKQDKKRNQEPKVKCAPLSNQNNDVCDDGNGGNQQATNKSNSNSCPRKGCFPTPKSICGCHFYFNVENRTRRQAITTTKNDQIIGENNETPYEYGYSIYEEPEHDNLATSKGPQVNSASPKDNKRKNSTKAGYLYDKRSEGNKNVPERQLTSNKRHSANEGRKASAVAFRASDGRTRRSNGISYNGQRKSSLCRRKSVPEQTEKPSQNDVHIGLTFTKETKFFLPNNDTCLSSHPEPNSGGELKNSQSDDSEELLTVEIHKSGVKLTKSEEMDNNDDHKNLKRAPQSESLSREVLPMLRKKDSVDGRRAIRLSISEDESEESIYKTKKRRNSNNRHSLISKGYSKTNLDRRVSEILKKLNEIENKINIIEKKRQDNKKILVDFDGAKSTVSLHIKDPGTKKCDNGYNHNNGSKEIDTGNTVIEIRQTQSKPSPVRTSFQENEPHSSQSLDAFGKNQPSSHKIVIKLPKINAKTQCFVLPDKQNKEFNENCKQTNTWIDVSNELKCSPTKQQCYCYECLQKRLRCV